MSPSNGNRCKDACQGSQKEKDPSVSMEASCEVTGINSGTEHCYGEDAQAVLYD